MIDPAGSMPGSQSACNRAQGQGASTLAGGRRCRAGERTIAAPQVDGTDIGIGIALHAGDALVARALPFADRMLAVPDVVQAPVLFRQAQFVALAHVQIGAGDGTAAVLGWHGRALLEVHHEGTGTVLAGLFAKHAETEVAAVTVYLADHRDQIVQIGFGQAENGVLGGALLAPALLPALTLMADDPGRNDVKCAR